MNMDVEEAGRNDRVTEIDEARMQRRSFSGNRGNLRNAPIFHDEQRVLDLFDGSKETACSENSFHEESLRYRVVSEALS
jgi:hypothetical protein